LSYTTFSVVDLRLSKTQAKTGDALEATATVTNTGAVAGDEVVQLYIHQRVGSTSRPIRELQGFERIALQPESRQSFASRLGKRNLPIGAKAGELGWKRRSSSMYGSGEIPTLNCMEVFAWWNRNAIYDCGAADLRAALGVSWSSRRAFAETSTSFAKRRMRVSSCLAQTTQWPAVR